MSDEEQKAITKTTLISEIIRKSEGCALVWRQISVSQYRATSLPYDFFLSKTNFEVYALDVWKNTKLYRSYQSTTVVEVEDLFHLVDSQAANSDSRNRLKTIVAALSKIPGGCNQVYDLFGNGGAFLGSSAVFAKLTPANVFLLPSTLDFGESEFPWSGTIEGIDDAPDADANDGDATFIRQSVSGPLPTQWGYAIAGFDLSEAGNSGPYTVNVRVVHRREANNGVNLVVDVVANSAVVFSETVLSDEIYSMYESGEIPVSTGGETLTDLSVRVSMFTNTGDEEPRAIRISAIDVQLNGFDSF
jgi:hypothetical protein